jgi:hypothetical protein
LEHLSVYYNHQYDGARGPNNLVTTSKEHGFLKEVTIWMKGATGYQNILSIGPLFSLVELNHLPSLNVIKICGSFPGGCVDRDFIMPQDCGKAWRDAVRICKKHRVMLVNTSGDSMHVWSMQHGIKWKDSETETEPGGATSDPDLGPAPHSEVLVQGVAEVVNEDVNFSSEREAEEGPHSQEDQWREVETDTSFEGSEISPSDIMSDDSEDIPYHYVHQLDIDFVNSDLEVSDE